MKRMSEIFELPLPLGEMDCMVDVFIHSDIDTDESVVAMHAAHAINHVDALADALDALTYDYATYKAINGIDLTDDHNAKLDVKMETARRALSAYRGEA